MKRVISLIILLICLLLILEWEATFLKKNHQVEYQVNSQDKTFDLLEEYQKEKNNTYYLKITNSDYTFIYTVINKFNKQKQIVTNIEIYEKDGMLCISPILINDENLEIECSNNGQIYSYEAVSDNQIVKDFVSNLKEKGYSSIAWENESSTSENYTSLEIYKDNLLDEDYITVWNYKGIDIINKTSNTYEKLYDYDKYENTHGSIVGKYYIAPVYTSNNVFDFSKLNIIDIESGSLDTMDLETTLNQDTYINGVVDNQLYYFDSDNLAQYEINPNKKKIRQIGNKDSNAQFYNGTWETINIYDFVNTKKQFELKIEEKVSNYQPISVYQSATNYYYMTSDGSFYKLNKNNLDNPVLLWRKTGLKEIKIIDDTVYFIIGDTLYYYDASTGIRKVIKNNEWNYNYTNIYDVYRKPE